MWFLLSYGFSRVSLDLLPENDFPPKSECPFFNLFQAVVFCKSKQQTPSATFLQSGSSKAGYPPLLITERPPVATGHRPSTDTCFAALQSFLPTDLTVISVKQHPAVYEFDSIVERRYAVATSIRPANKLPLPDGEYTLP